MKTGAAIAQTQILRGKTWLNRSSGGKLVAGIAAFAPNVTLTKSLVPSSPTAIPTGKTFHYRLNWRCASSGSPADDCFKMVISDGSPANMEFVPPATFAAPVNNITTSGSNPQTVTFAFVSPVSAGSTGEVEIPVRYIPGTTPNGLNSTNPATIKAEVFGVGTASNNSNLVNTTAVASTIRGGAMTWAMEIDHPGNVPFTNINVIDILPFNAPAHDAAFGQSDSHRTFRLDEALFAKRRRHCGRDYHPQPQQRFASKCF